MNPFGIDSVVGKGDGVEGMQSADQRSKIY